MIPGPANRGELTQAALALNLRGRRVFPVKVTGAAPDGLSKKPCIRGYHGDGPFDAAKILRWPWQRASALGWALPEGYILLDIDCKNGKTGHEQLRLLQEVHGPLPKTAEQRTPSGGRHLVFRVPATAHEFRGVVPAPNGHPSCIDICHSKNRYMAVYDLSIFDQAAAELPARWIRLISKPTSRRAPVLTGKLDSDPARAVVSPVDRMAGAVKGARNNTLNEVVFGLACRGEWDEQCEDVLAAATARGLSATEIKDTVASATSAAERQHTKARTWLEALENDTRLLGQRHRPIVVIAARTLCVLAQVHGLTVGISVRDLGERLGVSQQTGAKILRRFRTYGYLERVSLRDRENATMYRLVVPEHAKADTPQPRGTTTRAINDGGVSAFAHLEVVSLYGHDAFIRLAGTTTMPKSSAWVLAAVADGATTVKAISETVPLSPSTVRRNLLVLESAGLLTRERAATITVHLVSDLQSALHRWAEWSGALGNAKWLKERHAWDRKQLADARDEWSKRPLDQRSQLPRRRRTGHRRSGGQQPGTSRSQTGRR